MVDVELGALGPFEEDVLPRFPGPVEFDGNITEIWGQFEGNTNVYARVRYSY